MSRVKRGVRTRARHRKILKQAKLVKNRRAGKSIFYSLADDHVSTILAMGLEHIEEQ